MNQQSLTLIFSQIGALNVSLLLLGGFLFGLAFTYLHFYSINRYILNGGAFKKKIFILTFVRLVVFGSVLAVVAYPNFPAVRMMTFFVAFMVGRILMMRLAKKEISK